MSTDILLIDLSSLAHQAWHTCSDDPNPDACSIKTIARVRSLASGKPHVAICLDTPPYFRKDIDPDYKANRAKDNNAVIAHQIALAVDVLKEDYCILGAKGYEADDIIATAVAYVTASNKGNPKNGDMGASIEACRLEMPWLVDMDVTIASADKDLLQLVSDRVTVLSTSTGNRMDPDAVKEKLGVWPHQVVDYLSLVGDTSDNVKGAKGIGAKRAVDVLGLFGNLDDAIKAATEGNHEKPDAVITSLQEFAGRVETVRSLIRLRTDAPIAFEDIFKERKAVEVSYENSWSTEGRSADESQETPTDGQAVNGGADGHHEGRSDSSGDVRSGVGATRKSVPVEQSSWKSAVGADGISAMNDAQRIVNAEASRKMETVELVESKREYGTPAKPKPDGPPESTSLVAVEWNQQLEPRDMRQAAWIAQQLFQSKLFGAYGTPAAVLSTIMAGRELGFSTMASLRAFHIIENKPTMSAGAIHALVLRSGKAKFFRCTERTAERVTFETQRGDDPLIAMTYTIEEAQQAWTKDTSAWNRSGWGKHPADMLVARCSSKLARLVYPDVCHGLYAEEEIG